MGGDGGTVVKMLLPRWAQLKQKTTKMKSTLCVKSPGSRADRRLIPAQTLGQEHLPDAVTIVTMLHFLPAAPRGRKRLNVKRGGRGAGRDSFGPSLGIGPLIMCLHTPTCEDGLSLHCAAQRDNGGPVDGHVPVTIWFSPPICDYNSWERW